MAGRGVAKKLKCFEKVLLLMIDGKPITVEEIEQKLGDQIQMYRISNYVWKMKKDLNLVVRHIKDGKNLLGYQLINTKDALNYIEKKYANI